jgi:hypothetical protein
MIGCLNLTYLLMITKNKCFDVFSVRCLQIKSGKKKSKNKIDLNYFNTKAHAEAGKSALEHAEGSLHRVARADLGEVVAPLRRCSGRGQRR